MKKLVLSALGLSLYMASAVASLPLDISQIVSEPVGCNSATSGSLTITVTGGVPPYSYATVAPSVPPLKPAQASNVLADLAAGAYTVQVTDSAVPVPNVVTEGATVGPVVPLVIVDLADTPVTCFGGVDGSVSVTATGGKLPLTFAIVPSSVFIPSTTNPRSGTFVGVAAGLHTVTVNSADGCPAAIEDVVVETPAELILATSFTGPTCNGLTDGTITATVTGGTAPYTFSLNGQIVPSTGSTHVFSALAAGTYQVSIDDARGCGPVAQQVVLPANTVTITSIDTTPAGCPDATGTLTVVATGPVGATLQYTIVELGVTNQTGIFTGVPSGIYTVRVETVPSQTGACAVASATVTAVGIVVSVVVKPQECLTGVLGSITASATGGTAPFTFSIDGTTFQTSGVFANLQAGTYTITARDANGCIGTASATVGTTRGITGNALTDFISRKYCNNAC